MVPTNEINILNPRERNKKKFQVIVNNIANIGLKRPITVSEQRNKKGEKQYNLVCGQGRLEAYIALGEEKIPAIVKNIPEEECFLMSLVENLARRKQLSVEYVKQIGLLSQRGYKSSEIAKKIDANPEYVRGILRLFENGEERLIAAVIKEQIPISTAVEISAAKDDKAQLALLDAYESNKLRGRALITVRRILDKRRLQGKTLHSGIARGAKNYFSADALVRTYKKETERRKLLIKKAKICEARLLFITSALKGLFQDKNYVNLLQAEQLDLMPKNLMNRIESK
ncbi:MAG: ParB N-terminal domain-containing protein [Deltaproteobacteria bacterium]|nr:ParB N-terminal domain-containing protein [Deltaproteobacteria bacterium]MBT6501458.1 ParB N-terminal domain-containing protein [Deltaproteobacteria bacterium]